MATFTSKQVFILVFCIVAGIAFIETSSPVPALSFLREFGLNLIGYTFISVIMVIILISINNLSD